MATLYPQFANGFSTTLASSVANGSTTSFSLTGTTGLPTLGTDQYIPMIVVDTSTTPETIKEVVYVTAITGAGPYTATVVRAAEDASRFPAGALASGLTVAAVTTAGTLSPIVPKVTASSLGSALSRTDPQIVPIHSGTIVPGTTGLLVDFDVCARAVGPSGAQFIFAFGDNTLGRQPHPQTQAEYTTPPGGISYDQLANISPSTAQVYATRADGGASAEQHASRMLKKTGLTAGHTYNWEVCVGIVGAASDASPCDVNISGRPAPIRHKFGSDTWKVYIGADTSKRVDSTVFSAGIPVQVSTIRTGSASIANNPKDIVTNSKQSTLIFLCQTSNAIQVWDPVWDRTVSTFTPSVAPVRGDLTPDGSVLAFVGGTSLYLMNTAAGTFSAATSTTDTPVDVKFNPATSAIWVLCSNGKMRGWNYAGTGTTIGTAIGTITPAANPSAVTASRFCIGSDGIKAWFADDTNGKLTQVNLSTLVTVQSIALSGAGPYVGCERFPGSDSTVLVVASAASTNQICQVNVADWTIWTQWANKLSIPGATNSNCTAGGLAITGDGCIFVSDTFNNGVNCWFGSAFEFDPSYFLNKDYLDVVFTEVVA